MKLKYLIGAVLGVAFVYIAIATYHDDSEKYPQNTAKSIDKELDSQTSSNNEVLISEENKNINSRRNNNKESITEFNEILIQKGFRPDGSRPTVNFEELKELSKTDIVKASSKIINMAENPKENFFELLELNYRCTGLFENKTHLKTILDNRPFEKSLWDSGYCNRFGTNKDPFFDYLTLARQGDKLAQLTLNAELYNAIERGAINPKLKPAEYNDLRYEVIGYLKGLSAQGVGLASLKLSREYLNNTQFYPEDKVLSYFYLKLYEKQHLNFQDYPWNECYSDSDFCKSPTDLYMSFSKKEQARADRLLQRAGY